MLFMCVNGPCLVVGAKSTHTKPTQDSPDSRSADHDWLFVPFPPGGLMVITGPGGSGHRGNAGTRRDQLIRTATRRLVPRNAATRAASASMPAAETAPASWNKVTLSTLPLASQVPATRPPASTTGEIQPAALLISLRRAAAMICVLPVPGPSTYWSNPSSSRTSALGSVPAISPTSAARAYAG